MTTFFPVACFIYFAIASLAGAKSAADSLGYHTTVMEPALDDGAAAGAAEFVAGADGAAGADAGAEEELLLAVVEPHPAALIAKAPTSKIGVITLKNVCLSIIFSLSFLNFITPIKKL
ncbi:MAG: hypothetical protein FWF33_03775 [Clostridiales bacterium]|nr:hypothetical protein [Clostridiales bacterium]